MSDPQGRALMIQGTGSNVGKSLLVAGLCRAARLRGIRVAPFKPQNMSNNAAVTIDGGEIGRAQALQAQAAGLLPHTDMNPVLLKPETDVGAQVVVQGRRLTTTRAREYQALKPQLLGHVRVIQSKATLHRTQTSLFLSNFGVALLFIQEARSDPNGAGEALIGIALTGWDRTGWSRRTGSTPTDCSAC